MVERISLAFLRIPFFFQLNLDYVISISGPEVLLILNNATPRSNSFNQCIIFCPSGHLNFVLSFVAMDTKFTTQL